MSVKFSRGLVLHGADKSSILVSVVRIERKIEHRFFLSIVKAMPKPVAVYMRLKVSGTLWLKTTMKLL